VYVCAYHQSRDACRTFNVAPEQLSKLGEFESLAARFSYPAGDDPLDEFIEAVQICGIPTATAAATAARRPNRTMIES
jgi:hypothetical protein